MNQDSVPLPLDRERVFSETCKIAARLRSEKGRHVLCPLIIDIPKIYVNRLQILLKTPPPCEVSNLSKQSGTILIVASVFVLFFCYVCFACSNKFKCVHLNAR